MAKPITYYSLVHKATNKVLSTHKDLESAKDEHRGMDQGERAHYRIATSTKAPKSFSMKEDAEGVAEAAFRDPSPMMKDSIKQDKIRSLNNLISIAKVKGIHHKVKEYESELKKLKEASVFPYKPPRKGSVAYNALMKRKEQDKNRVKEIEAIGTKNHHVGVAKVTKAVAEGTGKNVVKSVKVGNFRHDLVDTGMGWQVRIYNGDELHDTGMSKNSEQKGLAALEDAVAYTEKQTRTKRQDISEKHVPLSEDVSKLYGNYLGQILLREISGK